MSSETNQPLQLLFAVQEAFNVQGRGLVVTSASPDKCETFENGAIVTLKRPDGTQVNNIAYKELITPNMRKVVALSLPGLSKTDVPSGTEVWIETVPESSTISSKRKSGGALS